MAFYGKVGYKVVQTGHWSKRYSIRAPAMKLRGTHEFYHKGLANHKKVYILRDGRDVALSMWRSKELQHIKFKDLTFSEFLRTPLDWYETPGKKTSVKLTILEHWYKHVTSWWSAKNTLTVSYEDAMIDIGPVLERISTFYALPLQFKGYAVGDIGPSPSGEYAIAKWKEQFTQEDLEYYEQITI